LECGERHLARLTPALERAYAGAGPCHDLSHAIRVARLAGAIASRTEADECACFVAGLFHDAGRAAGVADHEHSSAEIAHAELAAAGYGEETHSIARAAILAHRFRGSRQPAAACRRAIAAAAALADADRLDAIGAIGIARVYLFSGEHGWRPEIAAGDPGAVLVALESHWDEKLRHIAGAMRTPPGLALARERAARMPSFLEWLREELTADARVRA
jgi:uncharacterized protein